MGKIFRRTLTALLIVIFALSAAIVGAKIQMYTATGEDYANEVESQDIAKLRARDKAIKKATKEAGVYLKTYSRSVNSELTDDEVTAITSNAWQLVSEPKYSSKIVKGSDETSIIIWTATVEVNVDDSELQSWIRRDNKDKSTLIEQTREAQKASEENERKIEDLREKYNRATSQAEKDSIRKQMNDTDRDFLANQKLDEGNKLFYEGKYEDAIKLYNEVIELKPNSNVAYNNRGFVYYLLKQYERAIQDLDKAIELNSNDAAPYGNRGYVYFDLGQYERALHDFNTNINIGIENNFMALGVFYKRGATFFKLGQYENAITDLNLLSDDDPGPNDSEFYQIRGFCHQQLGDEAKAQADFARAESSKAQAEKIKTFRMHLFEQYNNATLQAEKNRLCEQMSKDEREFFAKQKIKDANESRFSQKNYENAIKIYNEVLQLNPNSDKAYWGIGECYRELKDYENSIKNFAKAIQLNPKEESYYYDLEKILKDSGDYEGDEGKIAFWNKFLKLVPNSDYAYSEIGDCYRWLDDYENALKSYAKAIQINPNNPDYYNERAHIFNVDLDDYEQAIAEYKKILEIKFDNAKEATSNYVDAYIDIGNIYRLDLKDYKQAIESYSRAVELNPNYAQAYYWLGRCYELLGDNAKAQADFAKAKELGYNG